MVFQDSELCHTLSQLMEDSNNLPFNYKTISYLRKILNCNEVEDDVKEFKMKEPKIKQRYSDMINKDFRTKFLKDN